MSKSSLFVEIKLPNGKSYEQPTGLFINNEFVPGTSHTQIDVTDPASVQRKCPNILDNSNALFT